MLKLSSAGNLKELLKKSFSNVRPGTEEFNNIIMAPVEDVVNAHEDFFKKLARQQCKLNKSEVLKQYSALVKGDTNQMSLFVEKLVQAQRHCWGKSKQLTTGERLPDAVRRVAVLYKKSDVDIEPCQPCTPSESDQSPSSLGLSSAHDALAGLHKAKSMWDVASPVRKIVPTAIAASPMSVASSAALEDEAWVYNRYIYIYIGMGSHISPWVLKGASLSSIWGL